MRLRSWAIAALGVVGVFGQLGCLSGPTRDPVEGHLKNEARAKGLCEDDGAGRRPKTIRDHVKDGVRAQVKEDVAHGVRTNVRANVLGGVKDTINSTIKGGVKDAIKSKIKGGKKDKCKDH